MLWVGVQMNLKTNIEATKEKYEGPQLALSKFAPDFGSNKPVYVILCDHLDLVLKLSSVK